ncbi:MAG: hypothetical protein AAFR98_13645, partial [Pseudomonadota bacterium]
MTTNSTKAAAVSKPNGPKASPGKRAKGTAFGEGSRTLLRRFFFDWVVPRRKELFIALLLTALLAAATGGYPLIIKLSFDTLMGETSGGNTVFLVLAAIIAITCTRSILLYFQT